MTIAREGRTLLVVPSDYRGSGPSSSRVPVFYNPTMEFSRDISVAVLGRALPDGCRFLDGLTATGARGIRLAKESGKDIRLHLNDWNPMAVELARRNLALNGITAEDVTCTDLRRLLLESRFEAIDVDPFGSPAQFVSLAASSIRNNGLLCITATDTGTISGIFPNACRRRYGTTALRTSFYHEIGLRNLLGFVAREAAKEEVGIEPMISFYADHYVRCIVRCRRGARHADDSLRKIGFCAFDEDSLERRFVRTHAEGQMGPIWTGRRCDSELLRDIALPPSLGSANRISRYFDLLSREDEIHRPHFTVDEMARRTRTGPPNLSILLDRLAEIGSSAPTHFGPKTFATDVEVESILDIFRDFRGAHANG